MNAVTRILNITYIAFGTFFCALLLICAIGFIQLLQQGLPDDAPNNIALTVFITVRFLITRQN